MGKSRKGGVNRSGPLGPLGSAIPYFDLTGYTLDPERPWVIEGGAVVWNVTRLFSPCAGDCPFVDRCPTPAQLTEGTRTADFAHVNVGDTPQRVRITVPRWFLDSGTGRIELLPSLPHPGVAVGHRFTREALECVIRRLLDPNERIEKIAQDMGVEVRTIYRIKGEFIPMPPWPITLCINPAMTCFRIDEIYIPKRGKNRKAYTLLLDATHNSFIALIPGTKEDAIGPALAAIRARCNIVAATMDFGDYVPIVKNWFPGIKITGDKFHLIQRFQEIMDNARKSAAHDLEKEALASILAWLNTGADELAPPNRRKALLREMTTSGVAQKLEDDLYLFKTNFRALNAKKKRKIQGWLNQLPALRAPFIALQRIYVLLNREDLGAEKGKELFWEIADLLKRKAPDQYKAAEKFFETRRDEIEAYFDTSENNSRAEGFNRQIRDRLAISRGLRYQELVRQLILLYSKGAPMCPPGAPDKLENQPPFKACAVLNPPESSRHGKHARRSSPLEDPDPQGELDFDPQGDLNL